MHRKKIGIPYFKFWVKLCWIEKPFSFFWYLKGLHHPKVIKKSLISLKSFPRLLKRRNITAHEIRKITKFLFFVPNQSRLCPIARSYLFMFLFVSFLLAFSIAFYELLMNFFMSLLWSHGLSFMGRVFIFRHGLKHNPFNRFQNFY